MKTLKRIVLGHTLQVRVQELDEGWDILVIGGSKTHMGAVTLADPGGTEQTLERKDHRDSQISRPWVLALANAWNAPVCVRCGVHYDGISKKQIDQIVEEFGRVDNSQTRPRLFPANS